MLRDGAIVDGSGSDASAGSVAVVGGRIAAIGDLRAVTARAVVDCASLSAERFGLADRGRIAPGLAADLVVFDPTTAGDNTTRAVPNRAPSGIETVVLNGTVVVSDGRFDRTARAGQVVRRAT